MNHLHHGFAAVVWIGINQPRLAQHVRIIRFDNRDSLTAGAALVAFVGRHEASRQSIEQLLDARLEAHHRVYIIVEAPLTTPPGVKRRSGANRLDGISVRGNSHE